MKNDIYIVSIHFGPVVSESIEKIKIWIEKVRKWGQPRKSEGMQGKSRSHFDPRRRWMINDLCCAITWVLDFSK